MTQEEKPSEDQANSGPEEEKSEEFKNFEKTMRAILAIPQEDIQKILKKKPPNEDGQANN